MNPRWLLALTVGLVVTATGSADDGDVRAVVARTLPLLQKGARTFRDRSEGKCIGCHHQGPLQETLALARPRGFAIDEGLERAEMDRLHGFYARRQPLYQSALTDPEARRRADANGNFNVHIGLWLTGYGAEGGPRTTATEIAALLLAAKQDPEGFWDFEDTARAPLQASDFRTTALAVRVLQLYAPPGESTRLASQVTRARNWLERTPARTTDDSVYKLRGLVWSSADKKDTSPIVDRLISEQTSEGSWAQQANMPGDAFATGLVLTALHQAGDLPTASPVYQKGVAYLLRTRHEDGSWFVRSRAIPSNPYFESGFPHGRSQFISYAATCYATQALLLTLAPKQN